MKKWLSNLKNPLFYDACDVAMTVFFGIALAALMLCWMLW